MGRQGHDTSAAAPGMRIQRSQSKMSLSASFEALAVYFPCMNSFDEEDGGKMLQQRQQMDAGLVGKMGSCRLQAEWRQVEGLN